MSSFLRSPRLRRRRWPQALLCYHAVWRRGILIHNPAAGSVLGAGRKRTFFFRSTAMARSKDRTQGKRRGKALGVVGMSLSLAGAACAESNPADASPTPTANVRTVDLHEVEIFDVTLSSFRVFDREDPQNLNAEGDVVAWWGCRGCGCGGCRGCGCRGCGCRGCRGCGCRGCHGCRGCGG